MTTPSRLAVILHADIVGSTALVQRDEQLAHQRMRAAFHRLVASTRRYHGIAHEVRGDALVAEFERASDAVCAALAFQLENAAANDTLSDGIRPNVRVGIALGEVIVAHGTVTGAGVVLAQRLEQLAEPGGLCVSAAVREALPGRLSLDFEALGAQQLKGFDEPVHAYQVTMPAGAPIPVPQAMQRRRPRAATWRAALVALGLALAAGGTWLVLAMFQAADAFRPPVLDTPALSIAVLPFANQSGDPDQDYLADVLTEELTSDLSRISGSFVIARGTTATYRGKQADPREIAQELNVRYLLEGTVRRAGGDVRVTTRMTDGQTAQLVWSEQYSMVTDDLYLFQQQVTGRVARALNLELKEAASRATAERGARRLDADDLAHRAWAEAWARPQTAATNEAALAYVARALEIEPDHAEALAVAAYAYARAANYGWTTDRQATLAAGIAAGERSFELDPDNADAVYSLGFLYFVADDTSRSQELMRQCIELNRNHAPAYFFYGINLIRLGRPREAIEWVERAFDLSPRDPLRSVWFSTIARARLLIAEDALAVDAAHKGIAANPRFPQNHAVLASAYAHQGKAGAATAALEVYRGLQPEMTIDKFRRQVAGDAPLAIQTYQRLIEGLARAGLPE